MNTPSINQIKSCLSQNIAPALTTLWKGRYVALVAGLTVLAICYVIFQKITQAAYARATKALKKGHTESTRLLEDQLNLKERNIEALQTTIKGLKSSLMKYQLKAGIRQAKIQKLESSELQHQQTISTLATKINALELLPAQHKKEIDVLKTSIQELELQKQQIIDGLKAELQVPQSLDNSLNDSRVQNNSTLNQLEYDEQVEFNDEASTTSPAPNQNLLRRFTNRWFPSPSLNTSSTGPTDQASTIDSILALFAADDQL